MTPTPIPAAALAAVNPRDGIEVTPVGAFTDNYIWLISAPAAPGKVVVIDPGQAAPVQAALQERGWEIGAILLTHHHGDHVGGVAELRQSSAMPVYGPALEVLPIEVRRLKGGDVVRLENLGLTFDVLDVPGHTAGHIAYVGHGAVFCGDTLFSAGCGRLFEGTAGQMTDSLAKLAALPGNTRVYCAHEYTAGNLRFAHEVEPQNEEILSYTEWCRSQRENNRPTLPSTIRRELQVNPFLRSHTESVKRAAESKSGRKLQNTTEIFAVVRQWKDGFR